MGTMQSGGGRGRGRGRTGARLSVSVRLAMVAAWGTLSVLGTLVGPCAGERKAVANTQTSPTGPGEESGSGPPSLSTGVLAKLHRANLEEIAKGRFAQEHGKSLEIKNFGRMLVKDHTATEKKVAALAAQEGVELPALEDGSLLKDVAAGPDFDAKFVETMVEAHRNDVSEAIVARANTADTKLKALLTALIPVLEKHQNTAQTLKDELVRNTNESTSNSMSGSLSSAGAKETP